MNLRDLRYLVAVAEQLNFGAAARISNVSQPTLSMQVKKLEEYLKVAIFERDNKRVMVTKEGQVIISMAREIVRKADDLIIYSKSIQDPFKGELRLGAFPTIAPYFLPKVVAGLKSGLPKIDLMLFEEKTNILLEKLDKGELDVAILAMPINGEDFICQDIFTDRFLLAVPKKHLLAAKKFVTIEDIKGQSLLLLEDGHCLREQALSVCNLSGALPNKGFMATSLETLRNMVALGSGISLIPEIAVENFKNNKLIKYIKFSDKSIARNIGAVYRKSTPKKQVIEKMIKIMQSAF